MCLYERNAQTRQQNKDIGIKQGIKMEIDGGTTQTPPLCTRLIPIRASL